MLEQIYQQTQELAQFYGQFKSTQHDASVIQLHIQIPIMAKNRPYGISFDLSVDASEYSDIAGKVVFNLPSLNKQPSNYGRLDIRITKPSTYGDLFIVLIRVENNPAWICCNEVPGFTFNALAAMMFAPNNIMYGATT